MATSALGLLASDLENTNGFADAIEACRTIVKLVDDHIQEQHYAGYSHADTVVPQTVEVSGMPPCDAQLFVYSELLMLYPGSPDDRPPGKGFKNVKLIVKPGPRGDEWILHTEWKNAMTPEQRREKKEIIERFTERLPRPQERVRTGARRPYDEEDTRGDRRRQ